MSMGNYFSVPFFFIVLKRNGGFIEMVHVDVIVGEISCHLKFFFFFPVKFKFSCY